MIACHYTMISSLHIALTNCPSASRWYCLKLYRPVFHCSCIGHFRRIGPTYVSYSCHILEEQRKFACERYAAQPSRLYKAQAWLAATV